MLMSLLCCATVAKSCLQCDSKVRRLNEDLGLSAPTVAEQIEIEMICNHAYVTYKETSLERMGVIGKVMISIVMQLNDNLTESLI